MSSAVKRWVIVVALGFLSLAAAAVVARYAPDYFRGRERVRALAEIDESIQRGDYFGAEQLCQKRIEKVRRSYMERRPWWSMVQPMLYDPVPVRRLANIYFEQGRMIRAAQYYRNILSYATNDPSLMYRYAAASAQAAGSVEALNSAYGILTNGIQMDLRLAATEGRTTLVTNEEPYVLLSTLIYSGGTGNAKVDLGKVTNALVTVETIKSVLKRDTLGTYLVRGYLALVGGKYQEAEQLFETAILEDGRLPAAYFAKALALRGQGNAAGAEAAFRECLARAPLRSSWRFTYYRDYALGEFLRNPNLPVDENIAQTVKELKELTEKAPDYFFGWRLLSTVARRVGALDLADKAAATALAMESDDYELHLASANIAQVRGETEQAISRMQRAVRQFPLRYRVRLDLARIQMAGKQWTRALETLKELESLLNESLSKVAGYKGWLESDRNKELRGYRERLRALASKQVSVAKTGAEEAPVLTRGERQRASELEDEARYWSDELFKRELNPYVRDYGTNALMSLRGLKEVFEAESNLQLGRSRTAMLSMENFRKDPQNANSPHIGAAILALAEAYRMEKRYDDALELYAQLFRATSNRDSRMPYSRGMVFRELDRRDDARREFELTLQVLPGHFGAMEQLVSLDLVEKRPDDAEKRLKEAIQQYPAAGGLHYLMGRVHESRGQTNEMAAALDRASVLSRGFPPAHIALARHYYNIGETNRILPTLKPIVDDPHQSVQVLTEVALIYDLIREFTLSRQLYERILRIDPNQIVALNNLAYLLAVEEGKPDLGIRMVREAQDLAAKMPMIADTLGWIHFLRGDYPLALPLLRGLPEKISPPNAEMYHHLGMTHYMLCHESEAIAALTQALQVTNNYRGADLARRCLAHLRIPTNGNPETVRRRIDEALKISPNDPVLVRRWVAAAGDLPSEQVLERLRAAGGDHPRVPALQIDLAEVLLQSGQDVEGAVVLLESIRDVVGADPRLFTLLGEALLKLDRPSAALPRILDGLRYAPDDPRLLLALGRAQFAAGLAADAKRSLTRSASLGAGSGLRERAKNLLALLELTEEREVYSAADLRAAERLAQAEPEELMGRFLAIRIKEAAGENSAEVRRQYGALMTAVPQFNLPLKRLAIMAGKGLIPEAEQAEIATQARFAFPKDSRVAFAHGLVQLRSGGPARAVALFEEVLSGAPSNPEPMYWLARAKAASGDKKGALEVLDRALKLSPQPALRSNVVELMSSLR